MRVAFYAPLKPPHHPVPSGDREMARALFRLLGTIGHQPFVASSFRTFDGRGDVLRQERLAAVAGQLVQRLLRHVAAGAMPRPDLWFTYHPYHKAPDLLGPAVSEALAIPFVVAESSIARKQAHGRWSAGHRATLDAIRRASLVLAMTERDRVGLVEALGDPCRVRLLRPFIDTDHFGCRSQPGARELWAGRLGCDAGQVWLVTVAMMREDVKRRSYSLLREALRRCLDLPWRLLVAGDGPARPAIEQEFAELGPGRVSFVGALQRSELPSLYGAGDVFVWPGLDEAYGLAILEAQAAGLPVVVGAEGGILEIVRDGHTGFLVDGRDPASLAAGIRQLIVDPARREVMGRAARDYVQSTHTEAQAASALAAALTEAGAAGAGTRAPGAPAMLSG